MVVSNFNLRFDLEERLIEFTVLIFLIVDKIYETRAGSHISGQLVRSGSSPSLNYGEAQSAESRKDFIHKLQVLLKELRETQVALKIIAKTPLTNRMDLIEKAQKECNELISIFVVSVKTARTNMESSKK